MFFIVVIDANYQQRERGRKDAKALEAWATGLARGVALAAGCPAPVPGMIWQESAGSAADRIGNYELYSASFVE